jgi:hypothetical protein
MAEFFTFISILSSNKLCSNKKLVLQKSLLIIIGAGGREIRTSNAGDITRLSPSFLA